MAERKKEFTEKDLINAASKISDVLNYQIENKKRFDRIEERFDSHDRHFQKFFFLMENDNKTGTIGVVQRISDLEKWRTEIDYLLANLKGQVMAYSAAAVAILYILGKLIGWVMKILPQAT